METRELAICGQHFSGTWSSTGTQVRLEGIPNDLGPGPVRAGSLGVELIEQLPGDTDSHLGGRPGALSSPDPGAPYPLGQAARRPGALLGFVVAHGVEVG